MSFTDGINMSIHCLYGVIDICLGNLHVSGGDVEYM